MDRSEKAAIARRAAGQTKPSSSGWGRTNCPFCYSRIGKPDRKQSFGVLFTTGAYHCFRCGVSGRIPEFATIEETPSVEDALIAKEALKPPDGFLQLTEEPARSSLSAEPARAYLRSRGLPEDIWGSAKIGACLSGKHMGRVIVPVLSPDGDWQGWVGRAWVKHAEMAYLYPRGMRRGEVLYNHAALFVPTDRPVMVVEGVFDALALWPDAVAVLGKPSSDQISTLAASKRPVAVVLDGDAWEEGDWLAMRLRLEGQKAGSVKLPPRKDPDEVNKSWLYEAAAKCVEASTI